MMDTSKLATFHRKNSPQMDFEQILDIVTRSQAVRCQDQNNRTACTLSITAVLITRMELFLTDILLLAKVFAMKDRASKIGLKHLQRAVSMLH